MTTQKINEFKQVKEFLKNKSLKVYEICNIEHFFYILNDFKLKEILTQEERNEIELNVTSIINNYNYLEFNIIVENKDDLMLFLMIAYLSKKDMNKLNKWAVADYLEVNNLFEVLEDRKCFHEELEKIKNY